MDELHQRVNEHGHEIARLKDGYTELKSEMKTLTNLTQNQNVELRTQTLQLQGIVKWQANIAKGLWAIFVPLLGFVGIALVVLIAILIVKLGAHP